MTTDTPLAMPSPAVAGKALCLPVRVNNNGAFIVASGSEPGKTHVVERHYDGPLSCSCIGGRGCSHEWAARAHADPAVRRALLARVRPARVRFLSLSRADTMIRQLERAHGDGPPERYDAARAAIVSRLTGGHAADDADVTP